VGMMGMRMAALLLVFGVSSALRGGGVSVPAELPDIVAPAIALVEVDATTGTQQEAKRIGIRGDCSVNGALSCGSLTSPTGNVMVAGGISVDVELNAASVKGSLEKCTRTTSIEGSIVPKGDGFLQILGKIDADVMSAESLSTSLLEIQGVAQWQLVSVEDFEEQPGGSAGDGWSKKDLTMCGGNTFLGGPCTATGNTETQKTFKNLPSHTQLRIVAKYLFIDSWDGESAYMKLDDRVAWSDTYNHAAFAKNGVNICGNDTPEGRYMRHIDVTVPHTSDGFDLHFGATTDEHSCDESFGVDGVMVFVR